MARADALAASSRKAVVPILICILDQKICTKLLNLPNLCSNSLAPEFADVIAETIDTKYGPVYNALDFILCFI